MYSKAYHQSLSQTLLKTPSEQSFSLLEVRTKEDLVSWGYLVNVNFIIDELFEKYLFIKWSSSIPILLGKLCIRPPLDRAGQEGCLSYLGELQTGCLQPWSQNSRAIDLATNIRTTFIISDLWSKIWFG